MRNKKVIDMILLRQQAEDQIALQPIESNLNISVMDILKLSHELNVHQIELEMQNDELMFRNEEIEKQAIELVLANKKLSIQNKEMNERTLELIKKSKELADFNSYYIGQESEIIQLKKEVNDLLEKAGENKKYPIS